MAGPTTKIDTHLSDYNKRYLQYYYISQMDSSCFSTKVRRTQQQEPMMKHFESNESERSKVRLGGQTLLAPAAASMLIRGSIKRFAVGAAWQGLLLSAGLLKE